ncbi:MAG: hypothetical protein H6719_16860 [Sandaracinaceae bacterium]|nr:hypothetical protein [Sandaracinaceae bacterium]
MGYEAERRKWVPTTELETTPRSLREVRDAVIECLVEARGGTFEAQSRYLDEVLARGGVVGEPEWSDLYRSLSLLQQDALAAGAEPRLVQEHVTRLHRILEQVE